MTKPQPFTYRPPTQLQQERIWSLVVAKTREEKVSEFNLTRKSPFALNTWDKAMERLNDPNSKQTYAPVVGIVSRDHIIIDIDFDKSDKANHLKPLPEVYQALLVKHPTHHHFSKSGFGWKIYYETTTPLPKKSIIFKNQDGVRQGELFCDMFVTSTDPSLSDFSQETVSHITREQLAEFIPEANKQPVPHKIVENQHTQSAGSEHIDMEKVLNEVQRMLAIIPTDINPLLEIAYDTRLKDVEVNSYNHWLLVSHALSDLVIQLASEYPNAADKIQILFHEWSLKGESYKGEQDCNERFERSLQETRTATGPIVSFSALRKLFWAYRIPISDFPVLLTKGKGNNQTKAVDPTDPENYEFLTEFFGINLCQEVSRGHMYIKGPPAIVKNYFSDNQFYYLTGQSKDISIPFTAKLKSDDNLIYRLIKLFRHFGIKGALRNHPIYAGLNNKGVQPIDTLYEWMVSKPWDKTPRIMEMVEQSVIIDETMVPESVPDNFLHSLIFKHLIHMAGLRAKAFRTIANTLKPTDRFKKAQGVLILAGYQNTFKSTWIECLLPSQASYVSNITPSSAKDTLEIQRALAGTFILNIDEIDAVFDTINLSDFKNMVTQDRDSFRTMYAQTFDDHPRAAGLFGTTNKSQLKLDRTGNRRFWLIPVKECKADIFNSCNYQQVWAELLHYAERLGVEDWNITGQDKKYINIMAQQYMKQTTSSKTFDMAFVDGDGESLVFDHTEIDFDLLLSYLPQRLQRLLVIEKLWYPVRGNKAFIHLQNKFIMDENIEFKLSSFSYEIASFLDNLMGFQNETKGYDKLIYKAGVISYRTGKPLPTLYNFIPYKAGLMKLIEEGEISSDVLIQDEE